MDTQIVPVHPLSASNIQYWLVEISKLSREPCTSNEHPWLSSAPVQPWRVSRKAPKKNRESFFTLFYALKPPRKVVKFSYSSFFAARHVVEPSFYWRSNSKFLAEILSSEFRGRRYTWWVWRVTLLAPRIGNDGSYVARITYEIHFAWQAQHLVKLEGDFCCCARWKRCFICEADHARDSFCVAGAVFGEVRGCLLLLRLRKPKHTKTILYFIDFKKRQQKDSIRQGTVCGARIRVPSPSARPWLFEMLTEIEECCLEGQQKQKHCRHPCQFHPKFQPISINLISIHHSCTLQLANSQSPLQWFIQPRRVYPASPGSCRILRQRMQLEWWPINSKTLSLHVNVRLNKYEDISQTPAANVITIQSYSIRFIWHCNAVAMEQFGHTATCLT